MEKRKKKEALAILLILLVGIIAYNYGRKTRGGASLSLPGVAADNLKDAVANNSAPSHPINAGADLTLPTGDDTQLKDSVAQSPALEAAGGQQNSNSVFNNPAPRGTTDGGIGNPGGPNPGSQLPKNNPPSGVSVSGPSHSQPD